jgi:hypothetical protein
VVFWAWRWPASQRFRGNDLDLSTKERRLCEVLGREERSESELVRVGGGPGFVLGTLWEAR